MKFRLAVAAAAAALSFGAAAFAEELPAPSYLVVEEDARIAFTSSIRDFEQIDDSTILIRTGANRLYRATLSEGCARGAFVSFHIGVETRGRGGFDRFSSLILDDLRNCPVETLDRVVRAS